MTGHRELRYSAYDYNKPYWVPDVPTPCRGLEVEAFTPRFGTKAVAEFGRTFCQECPVIYECFDAGIDQKETGIWGGVLMQQGRPVGKKKK